MARTGGGRVDLHAHTVFSDGVLTPAQLVARALDRGLAGLAITDHDAVDGIAPAIEAAAGRLVIVPGIEISTSEDGRDLHVLGYFIDPDDAALRARLVRFREERVERARRVIARLAELDVSIDLDEVLRRAGPGVVGRPHVAACMVEAGHVESIDESFRRYLGARAPAFVPRPAFAPEEAIALIHAAGGISVLAHPGAYLPDGVIEMLAGQGLSGIEVWHPQHGPALVRRYRELAARLDLLETGGSDFHAPGRGADLGEMRVTVAALRKLKQAAGVPG